jgi:hypothetical protein
MAYIGSPQPPNERRGCAAVVVILVCIILFVLGCISSGLAVSFYFQGGSLARHDGIGFGLISAALWAAFWGWLVYVVRLK